MTENTSSLQSIEEPEIEEFLTRSEVARLLHLTPQVLHTWHSKKKELMPSHRVGRKWLYNKDAVLKFLEDRRCKANPV
jgi:excisionase family DNA binding protein